VVDWHVFRARMHDEMQTDVWMSDHSTPGGRIARWRSQVFRQVLDRLTESASVNEEVMADYIERCCVEALVRVEAWKDVQCILHELERDKERQDVVCLADH
jgi:hypothetical protein